MRITALPCVPGPRHECTRYNVSVHLYYDINHVVRDIPVTMYTRHYSRASEAKRKGAGIIREIFKLDSLIACRLIYLVSDSRLLERTPRRIQRSCDRTLIGDTSDINIGVSAASIHSHSPVRTSRTCDTSYRDIGETSDDGK